MIQYLKLGVKNMPKVIFLLLAGMALILWGLHGLEAGFVSGAGRASSAIYVEDNPIYFYLKIYVGHFLLGIVSIIYAISIIRKK